MKRKILFGFGLVLISVLISGCFGKMPKFSGDSIGKWSITFNDKSNYDFYFDSNRFETKYNCEICCSGVIDSWKIKKNKLSGKTSCDKLVVSFEGKSDDKMCFGEYKIYTLTGEFLREGEFRGQKL